MVRAIKKAQIAVEAKKEARAARPTTANESKVNLTFTSNEFWEKQRANRPENKTV